MHCSKCHAALNITTRQLQRQAANHNSRKRIATNNKGKFLQDVKMHKATVASRRSYMTVAMHQAFERPFEFYFLQSNNVPFPSEHFIHERVSLIRYQPSGRRLIRFRSTADIPGSNLGDNSPGILQTTHTSHGLTSVLPRVTTRS